MKSNLIKIKFRYMHQKKKNRAGRSSLLINLFSAVTQACSIDYMQVKRSLAEKKKLQTAVQSLNLAKLVDCQWISSRFYPSRMSQSILSSASSQAWGLTESCSQVSIELNCFLSKYRTSVVDANLRLIFQSSLGCGEAAFPRGRSQYRKGLV